MCRVCVCEVCMWVCVSIGRVCVDVRGCVAVGVGCGVMCVCGCEVV